MVIVFLAAVLNYVDRQTLSALAPTIQHDLAMDDRAYADLVNLFLVAYTIAYLISGKLVDKLGTRRGGAIFVIWWSLANIATTFVHGVRSMGACRFMLGLGEAGVWPAASKAVSEWFPAKERATAIGLYTMGATVGATIAPSIVIPLAKWTLPGLGEGWRTAFLITGIAGFAWLVPWLFLYRKPRESQFISAEELAHIEQDGEPAEAAGEAWSWKQVLTFRPVWLLLFGRLLTDPIWYFFQFWFAKYLHSERGVSQDGLTMTWMIYAAAGAGSLVGGWLSGVLIKRSGSAPAARMRVMFGCACLMVPAAFLITRATSTPEVMGLAVCVVFLSLAWLTNITAIVVDVVPKHSVATVFSVVAAGSTLGGIVMNLIVATLVAGPSKKAAGFMDEALAAVFGPLLKAIEGRGYNPWFLVMAVLPLVAFLILRAGGLLRRRNSDTSLSC
ncbi:MFS transporter [Luteolibacter sp. LG18]|uniref:MFS transporter n=1 Tax=Luteolibacter sp. LG18 TaxID=2819286 RepID=UPI002B2E7AFC|nr:hypothetical protein llg_32280 [Luteolibacter sp. LG18]